MADSRMMGEREEGEQLALLRGFIGHLQHEQDRNDARHKADLEQRKAEAAAVQARHDQVIGERAKDRAEDEKRFERIATGYTSIAAGLKALAAQQSAIATQLANMAHQYSRVSDAWEQNITIQRQAIARADAHHADKVRRQDNADIVRMGAEREYRADNIAFRIASHVARLLHAQERRIAQAEQHHQERMEHERELLQARLDMETRRMEHERELLRIRLDAEGALKAKSSEGWARSLYELQRREAGIAPSKPFVLEAVQAVCSHPSWKHVGGLRMERVDIPVYSRTAFAEQLEVVRRALKLTTEQAAARTHTSEEEYLAIEAGGLRVVGEGEADRFLQVLGTLEEVRT